MPLQEPQSKQVQPDRRDGVREQLECQKGSRSRKGAFSRESREVLRVLNGFTSGSSGDRFLPSRMPGNSDSRQGRSEGRTLERIRRIQASRGPISFAAPSFASPAEDRRNPESKIGESADVPITRMRLRNRRRILRDSAARCRTASMKFAMQALRENPDDVIGETHDTALFLTEA